MDDLAAELGASPSSVARWAKNQDIPIRSRVGQAISRHYWRGRLTAMCDRRNVVGSDPRAGFVGGAGDAGVDQDVDAVGCSDLHDRWEPAWNGQL